MYIINKGLDFGVSVWNRYERVRQMWEFFNMSKEKHWKNH